MVEKITTRRVPKPRAPKQEAEVIDIVQVPTVCRFVQINIGEVDEVWRPVLVVDFLRFGTADEDWRATGEVFLAPGDTPFPNGTGMWIGDHGHCYVEIKPETSGEALGQWRWPPRA